MNYIGNVIKELRKEKNLTRSQLVDKICSIKYLYLIEKGERTPSAEMTRLFGFKLGVDLFEYFEFLDCQNPVGVHDVVKRFKIYHTIPDFPAIKQLNDHVRSWPDFQVPPWKYEIKLNDVAHIIFVERRFQEGIDYIQSILDHLEPCYEKHDFVANFLVALSSCYQEYGELGKAGDALGRAKEIIKGKEKLPRYNSTVIAVMLNKMTFCHLTGDYD